MRDILDRAIRRGAGLVLAALLAVLPSIAHAQAQPPVPPQPAASGWTATLYTGALSILTRGEKREYMAGRVTIAGPLFRSLSAFARGDATGAQDGGQLDVSDPQTFRSLEVYGGLRYPLAPTLSLAATAGYSYSIEGDEGAPTDARLYTLALLGRLDLGNGGYVLAGGGHHGPVGGPALLAVAAIPLKDGIYTVLDVAFPLQRNTLREKTWVIKIGATARVKSFKF
jgi:opacity protein-like surface antigen